MIHQFFAIALIFAATTPPSETDFQPESYSETVKLANLNWLTGAWEGEGIDGALATEVYSAPAGNQMVGHFRQLAPDGSVMFYELITIVQVGETIEYRLKHFDPDLSGWEEKAEVRRFPLLATLRDKWIFDGLIIHRETNDRMQISVRVKNESGSTENLDFNYRRL